MREIREVWLNQATEKLWPIIASNAGGKMPPCKVSVGFPLRRKGKGSHAIGQCWCRSVSKGDIFEIFVCPSQDNPTTVLAILLHEMIHATVGLQEGHKGAFKRVAKASGLIGKMTATAPGDVLTATLRNIAKKLGPYPHKELNPMVGTGPKKDGTRLLKVVCPDCEYTVRTTQKWIDVGLPTCTCGSEMIVS